MTKEKTELPHEEEAEEVSLKFSWNLLIPYISVIAIAMGGMNDTWDGVQRLWELAQSTMTDAPSRNRLNKIYINASSGVLEETFGAPIYLKQASSGDEITYFQDEYYILSAITRNDTIVAFLIFPRDGFTPSTVEHAGGEGYLAKPFSTAQDLVNSHSNIARVGSYYIEEIRGGKFDMLYSSVGGVSEFLGSVSPENLKLLANYNDQAMMEEDTTDSLKAFRQAMSPNFYGYSAVGIDELEQAILTYLEYELLTNKIG